MFWKWLWRFCCNLSFLAITLSWTPSQPLHPLDRKCLLAPWGSEMLVQLPAHCEEHFCQMSSFWVSFLGLIYCKLFIFGLPCITVVSLCISLMSPSPQPLFLFSIDWPCYPKGNVEQSSGDPIFLSFTKQIRNNAENEISDNFKKNIFLLYS